LWTALVAGESVKPVVDPLSAAGQVRIPLVKTAAGDLDYAVVLKYAGRLPPVGLVRPTRFPVIETVNIAVESSQVELRLPTTHSWLHFDGAMRALQTDGDLQAGQVAYQAKLAKRLVHTLKYGNPFEKARAVSNLKNVKASLEFQKSSATYTSGGKLQAELANAEAVIKSGDVEAGRFDDTDGDGRDNTAEILNAYGGQVNRYTRNVVLNNGGNWDAGVTLSDANVTNLTEFNAAWFVANDLAGADEPGSPSKNEAFNRIVISEDELASRQKGAQEVYDGANKDQIGKHANFWKSQYQELKKAPEAIPESARTRRGQKELMQRYQQALDGQGANQTGANPPRQQAARGAALGFSSATEQGQPMQWGANDINNAPGEDPAGESLGSVQAMPGHAGIRNDQENVGHRQLAHQRPPQRAALGLVGLQVALPEGDPARWRVYRFTTPRGDALITARAVRVGAIEAGKRMVTGLLAVLVALLLFRLLSGLAVANLNWRRYGLAFIAAGVLGLLLGIFPVLSGLALLAGILLLLTRSNSHYGRGTA